MYTMVSASSCPGLVPTLALNFFSKSIDFFCIECILYRQGNASSFVMFVVWLQDTAFAMNGGWAGCARAEARRKRQEDVSYS